MEGNRHFKVTMVENRNGRVTTIEQECFVPTREDVISIYGLEEPDIERYEITEIK